MRQITQLAVNAFIAAKNFNQSNTRVKVARLVDREGIETGAVMTELYLHNNRIAYKLRDRQGEETLHITSAGWETVTTKERLNGLGRHYGFSIHQKAWEWYLNGQKWENTNKLTPIK